MNILFQFDVRTVALFVAMTFFVQATAIGAQAYMIRDLKQYRGIHAALLANLCAASALMLRLFANRLPEIPTIILSNALLVSGPGLFYIALGQFTGFKYSWTYVISVITAVVLLLLYFIYWKDDLAMRMIVVSLGSIAMVLILIYQLLQTQKTSLRLSANLMLVAFIIYEAFLIVRTVSLALDPPRNITAYRGPWQTGAALYRAWAESRRSLIRLERQQPAWVSGIRFVVTMNLDLPLLPELARHCNPPQTLLYLPDWRRDTYDRNYPDYTATTNFNAFVLEAHRLGFRVMPHVNYFGCDPKHPLYQEFRPFQMRDPFTKELLWWEWPADPPIRFAYINPASRAWRELFIARLKEVVERHRVDAFHLDQALCIYNDANGLIDGLTCLEGNLALHRELRAALPGVTLSGERCATEAQKTSVR